MNPYFFTIKFRTISDSFHLRMPVKQFVNTVETTLLDVNFQNVPRIYLIQLSLLWKNSKTIPAPYDSA